MCFPHSIRHTSITSLLKYSPFFAILMSNNVFFNPKIKKEKYSYWLGLIFGSITPNFMKNEKAKWKKKHFKMNEQPIELDCYGCNSRLLMIYKIFLLQDSFNHIFCLYCFFFRELLFIQQKISRISCETSGICLRKCAIKSKYLKLAM